MITILSALVSLLSLRVSSRTSLELELIAVRLILLISGSAPTAFGSLLNRPFVLWLYRARPQFPDTWYSSNRRPWMASQGRPHLLATAITPFWTIQNECRSPRPDPLDKDSPVSRPVQSHGTHHSASDPWRTTPSILSNLSFGTPGYW